MEEPTPTRHGIVATSLLILALVGPSSSCQSPGGPSEDYRDLYDRGAREMRVENFTASRETFRQLLATYPEEPFNPNVELLLAACEYKLGNDAAARRIYEKVLLDREDPSVTVLALHDLGTMELKLGNYRAATERLREALGLEEDPGEKNRIRYRIALSLQQGGKFDEGRRVFEEVIQAAPGSDEARLARERLELPDYFTIQVGAYGERQNAETLRRTLRSGGQTIEVQPVESAGGKTLYRVWVGRHGTRSQALAVLKRLEASKHLPPGAMVIP